MSGTNSDRAARIAAHAERIAAGLSPVNGCRPPHPKERRPTSGYPCPTCAADSRVVDTRWEGNARRRRRECAEGHRFTTYERAR